MYDISDAEENTGSDHHARAGTTFLHGIYHKSKGTELARLKTVWTKFR
ncbi:MAG: hypothetical protein WCC06_02265 [Candidatus Aminicenantales bacterium]